MKKYKYYIHCNYTLIYQNKKCINNNIFNMYLQKHLHNNTFNKHQYTNNLQLKKNWQSNLNNYLKCSQSSQRRFHYNLSNYQPQNHNISIQYYYIKLYSISINHLKLFSQIMQDLYNQYKTLHSSMFHKNNDIFSMILQFDLYKTRLKLDKNPNKSNCNYENIYLKCKRCKDCQLINILYKQMNN